MIANRPPCRTRLRYGAAGFFFASLLFASEATALCYPSNVTRVIDGDTIVAELNLGFKIRLYDERIRLLNFDAPEPGQPGGSEATATARQLMPVGTSVTICGDRRDSFGRILATIWIDGEDFSQLMTEHGHALPLNR